MQTVQHANNSPAGNTDAEIIRRHIFEMMRFIENDALIGRQNSRGIHAADVMANCKVCEKQVVVDHEDVRTRSISPRFVDKTCAEMTTLAADARIAFRGDLFPNILTWNKRKIGLAAVAGITRPGYEML